MLHRDGLEEYVRRTEGFKPLGCPAEAAGGDHLGRGGSVLRQLGSDQAVVEHSVGLVKALPTALRDESGVAAAGADEVDFAAERFQGVVHRGRPMCYSVGLRPPHRPPLWHGLPVLWHGLLTVPPAARPGAPAGSGDPRRTVGVRRPAPNRPTRTQQGGNPPRNRTGRPGVVSRL